MNRLSQYKVSFRLAALVVISLAVLLTVAATALWGLLSSNRASNGVMTREVPAISTVSDLRASLGNLRRFEKDMFLHVGATDKASGYQKKWKDAAKQAHEQSQRLSQLLPADEQDHVTSIRKGLQGYEAGMGTVATRLLKGEFADAGLANQAMEPFKADVRSLDEHMDKLDRHIGESVQSKQVELQQLESRLTGVLVAAVLIGATAMVAAAWAIVRSITVPLTVASKALQRLAEGDLAQAIESRGRDELALMMDSMARTQAALREVVGNIQDNAQNVATASAQIAQGNVDLSTRTERQAASLQQTAASMEQLTSTVRQGAENARQANVLAQSASATAVRGGDVVTRVVQTMADIQGASSQIADITGVIDSIAFQTNILALNAAVEAARAGEQGRGFAVVAAEVRLLAQRSAEAARQIKSLIAASVDRVETGHGLVQDAGKTINEVVNQVRQVTMLMAGLTAAAEEQQRGIDQVGQAVTDLDQTTQQNAALVEESAAAAESLRSQAARLSEAVAVFRLSKHPA